MFVTTKFIAACTAIALLGTAGVASAQEFASNGRTTQVRFGDLDLANSAHQQELRSRIHRAASRVCASADLDALSACRAKAIAHVATPVATAIARAETGQRYADAGQNAGKEVRAIVGN